MFARIEENPSEVQSVCVVRISSFEPMEQAAIKDVNKLVDAVIPDGEVNDLGGLGNVGIHQIELAICLCNHIVRQSHRRGWYTKGKGVLVAREDEGVLEPKESPPAVQVLSEPAVEI